MILRSLQAEVASGNNAFLPAWDAVLRTQKQQFSECWMITQPSHAALSGELAAKLSSPQIPRPDDNILRAIALHDAGWGLPDAQAIMASRSMQMRRPQSFVDLGAPEVVSAWVRSIEVALSVSPAGGYIVSRHFWRIASHRLATTNDSESDRSVLQSYLDSESARQKKLAAARSLSTKDLELLTDVLQFCDLLSLYLCCGAQDKVVFPEFAGVALRITPNGPGYKLEPELIAPGTEFRVAALRHPATKEVSSQEIALRIVVPPR